MKLFGSNDSPVLGALIDIGSASVLAALVLSDPKKSAPDTLWSHREHIPLRNQATLSQSAKNVMTALINAAMQLDSTGRKVLTQSGVHYRPQYLQVTIAAPWVYTVTKTISYTQDEPFEVTKDLVHELARAAQQKIEEDLKENEVVSELGLHVIARTTLEMLANGYALPEATGQEAISLQLSRAAAVAQRYLTKAVKEIQEKTLPRTTLTQTSLMLSFHDTCRKLYPTQSEYCLVDISFEATEIGIVRDGVLRYCTHTPYGAHSLARDIAELQKTTTEEAYAHLANSAFLSEETKAEKAEDRKALYTSYRDRISELLRETGDSLAIPKTIIIHTNAETEAFFAAQVRTAAEALTKGTHSVLSVTSDLLGTYYTPEQQKSHRGRNDTAMIVSAQFFHNNHAHSNFEWQ